MKDATLINIEDVITKLVNNNKLFTAYDVTKTLRHDGFHVKHKEVRNATKDFQFPSYYKNSVDNTIGAIVYYPDAKDITEYSADDVPEFVINKQVNSTSPSIIDKRHRYCISASILRKAGFLKGMTANILIEDDKIVVYKGNDGITVTVDKSNNIRISKGTLQNAFGALPDSINITFSDGRVELSNED